MGKYSDHTDISVSEHYLRQLFKFLTVVTLLFLSCNSVGNKEDDASAVDSSQRMDSHMSDTVKPKNALNSIEIPKYKIDVSYLEKWDVDLKVKIILKPYFSNFPQTRTMKLIVYSASSFGGSGQSEDSVILDPQFEFVPFSTNSFSISTSHANLKKRITHLEASDYVLFTPVIIGENLVFKIEAFKNKIKADQVDLLVKDLGFSNPCPPAPPG